MRNVRAIPRSRRGRGLLHVVVVACLLPSCTATPSADTTPAPPADPLLDIAQREGAVVVIVQLAVPQPDPAKIATAQRALIKDLGPGGRVVERFGRKLPQIMLRVDETALGELRQSPLVVNITLNETDEPTE